MNIYKKYRQLKNISTVSLLEESPQLPLIFWGVAAIAGVILALIIWASFATIQQTSSTYGEIVPKGRVQMIQHLEGGIVKDVLVNNGDVVEKGQLLIRFDAKESIAELAKARSREISLVLDKERIQAYIENKPANLLEWSQEVIKSKYNTVERQEEISKLLEKEKSLLAAQNSQRANQRVILQAEVAQNKTQLEKFKNQFVVWKKHIDLLNQEFNMYHKLKEKNYVSHRDYLVLLREVNKAKGEYSRLESEIARLQKSVIEYEHKLKELDATLNTEALRELGLINDQLLEVRHQIEKLEVTVSHMNIYSPTDGMIKGMHVFPGNVVQPGGLLGEVVPANQELVAETQINPRDIGHVKLGDPVIVKPLTYDFSRYGGLNGRLTQISASSFLDKNGKPYYKAITELDSQSVTRGSERKHLKAGMTIQADIVTGKRTLMQYLLKPIRASAETAFSER